MLGAFIRLVDSLFVEALIAQVVACTKGLLSLLAGQKGSEKVRWAPLARCSAASSLCGIAQHIAQHLDLQLQLQSLQMTPTPSPSSPHPQERQVKGVLCTVISFCPDGYLFQPSEAAVLEELNNGTMEGIIALAHAAPRLLHMRMFAQHFEVGGLPPRCRPGPPAALLPRM